MKQHRGHKVETEPERSVSMLAEQDPTPRDAPPTQTEGENAREQVYVTTQIQRRAKKGGKKKIIQERQPFHKKKGFKR